MQKNKYNIPDKFVKLLKREFKPCADVNRYSISKLLGNIRENILSEQFEGEEDVSDAVPALLGTAMHAFFEKNIDDGAKEYKLEAKIGKYTIVGIIDNLIDSKIIDYKLKKAKDYNYDEHIKQIKLYAWLCRKNNIYVDAGEIDIIRKDWSKLKCPNESPIDIVEFNIDASDIKWAEEYILERIEKYEAARKILCECSAEDKWYTGTKYAVKKIGNKKAKKICDTREDAETYMEIGDEIEERLGENLKCEHYCKMYHVCKYYSK